MLQRAAGKGRPAPTASGRGRRLAQARRAHAILGKLRDLRDRHRQPIRLGGAPAVAAKAALEAGAAAFAGEAARLSCRFGRLHHAATMRAPRLEAQAVDANAVTY